MAIATGVCWSQTTPQRSKFASDSYFRKCRMTMKQDHLFLLSVFIFLVLLVPLLFYSSYSDFVCVKILHFLLCSPFCLSAY
jgi:hypothetical protein